MRSAPNPLPNDIDALRALVIAHADKNAQLTAENQRIKAQVLTLIETEQLTIAIAINGS